MDYYFHAASNEVKFDSTSIMKNFGAGFIVHEWFDSDEALGIAEKNGGENFRINNPEYFIEAALGEPVIPNSTTFWYITYRSKINNAVKLFLSIDANTGEVHSLYD